MYAPCALSSFARAGSTNVILPVTFFALSLGTSDPHWLQCTVPELPLPPLDRPLLALFFGIARLGRPPSFKSCASLLNENTGSLSGKIAHKAYSFVTLATQQKGQGQPSDRHPKQVVGCADTLFSLCSYLIKHTDRQP